MGSFGVKLTAEMNKSSLGGTKTSDINQDPGRKQAVDRGAAAMV